MNYAMDIHKLYEPLEYNINCGGKDIRRLTILYIFKPSYIIKIIH